MSFKNYQEVIVFKLKNDNVIVADLSDMFWVLTSKNYAHTCTDICIEFDFKKFRSTVIIYD